MPRFPRHHNAFQLAEIMGPDCRNASQGDAEKGLVAFFQKRGGFSYDPTRRRKVGVISRHVPLDRAVAEISTSGQPMGRRWNVELIQAIGRLYAGREYRCKPVKMVARPVTDGLLLRVPCDFFIVEAGVVAFEMLQLSRSEKARLSLAQVQLVESLAWHTLVRGDFSGATVRLCDLSKAEKHGERVPVWYSSADLEILSREELNQILDVYVKAYSSLVEHDGLPAGAYRKPHGWEEEQFSFL